MITDKQSREVDLCAVAGDPDFSRYKSSDRRAIGPWCAYSSSVTVEEHDALQLSAYGRYLPIKSLGIMVLWTRRSARPLDCFALGDYPGSRQVYVLPRG